jgi:probable F420-dependent oxidoreductase
VVSRLVIKFGVKLSHIDLLHDEKSILQASLVEELGFDSVWTGEHISIDSPTYDAVVGMAMMAALTTRVSIGSAIMLLPLRPPAVVAKALATIDRLSDGRVILGTGVGGEFAKEFEACGVPVAQRGARTDEAIAVIRRLWCETDVTFSGRFSQLRGITLNPRPIQPKIPIWIGGRSEAAMQRAGKVGCGFLPFLFDPKQYLSASFRVKEIATSHGHDPSQMTFALQQYICIADSHAQARQVALQSLGHLEPSRAERIVDRYCILGQPDECASRLSEFIAAGVGHFVFVPISTKADFSKTLETLSRDVVSQVRS